MATRTQKAVSLTIGSHAPHKWIIKNYIAKMRQREYLQELGIDQAHFGPILEYITHTSADEIAGSRYGNADIKLNQTYPTILRLRPEGDLHEWFLYRQHMQGIRITNPNGNIHFVDDSEMAILLPVAEAAKEAISRNGWLSDKILETGRTPYRGREYSGFHNISDILRGMGSKNFWGIVLQQAHRLGYADDPRLAYEHITCLARPFMADSKDIPRRIDAYAPFYMRHLVPPLPGRLQNMDYFFRSTAADEDPVALNFEPFFRSRFNTQLIATNKLAKYAAQCLNREPKKTVGYDSEVAKNLALIRYSKEAKELFVVQPAEGEMIVDGKPVKQVCGHEIITAGTKYGTPEEKQAFINARSMRFDNKTPHAVIFRPGNTKNHIKQLITNGKIKDAIVSKQTELHGLLIILVNLVDKETNKGCFDNVSASSAQNAYQGLNGNFSLKEIWKTLGFDAQALADSGVTHEASYYYHEIRGTDPAALEMAMNKIFEFHFKHHVPCELKDDDEPDLIMEGHPAPAGNANIVVYTSHDNKHIMANRDLYNFAKHQGNKGRNVINGGGGQEAMVSISNGYKASNNRAGGPHLTLITTYILEEKEGGKMPHCDLAIRCKLITHRMLALDTGHPYIVNPSNEPQDIRIKNVLFGGDGTDQEQYTKEINDIILFGGHRKNDFLVIYDPHYVKKDKTHRAMLGNENYNRLKKDHYALAHKNIYYATTYEEWLNINDQLAEYGRVIPRPEFRSYAAKGVGKNPHANGHLIVH